jgi:branched-chain amino acid transport system permease protein
VILQLLVNTLAIGCASSLLALGFGLVYTSTRVFNVGHGALYAATGYACYALLVLLHLPLVVACTAAVLSGAALGALMELTVFGPLARRDASALAGLISSLGVYFVVVNLLALASGSQPHMVLWSPSGGTTVAGVTLTTVQIAQVATFLVVATGFLLAVKGTHVGRIVRALRDNSRLLGLLGANVARVRILVFAAGAALSGFAAVFQALDVGVEPGMGMRALLTAAVAVIVGGVENFAGPAVGAFLLAIVQTVATITISGRWADAVSLLVLLVALRVRPRGLVRGHPSSEGLPA